MEQRGGDMRDGLAAISFAVRIVCLGIFASVLAGCVDTATPSPDSTASLRPANMPRREGISPAGASVAIVGVGGAPQGFNEQYQAMFGQQARAHDISVAEANKANYLVRSYLTATTRGAATSVAFVLDVFDAKRQRAQRIEDDVSVGAVAENPWSVVDQTVLAAVAARSADDLANFLTNTPEAIASNGVKPTKTQPSVESGETTVAASPPRQQPAQTPATAARNTGYAALH